MGSSAQDLEGALLIIFKTDSSVTGSKVSNGFPAKEVSGQAAGFGGEFFFQMVRILIRKDSRKVVSETLKEEVKTCFYREWC